MATTGSEKQRLTALIGVSASNNILPLYLVLKGKKVPAEVAELENLQLIITSNENAWMNGEGMLRWITRVWKPYSYHFSRSLLIMDNFSVHKQENVLKALEECRTDVVFVPPGMTFFSQPCDVYVNKALKDRVRGLWQNYMMQQKDTKLGNIFTLLLP